MTKVCFAAQLNVPISQLEKFKDKNLILRVLC